jgi:ribosome recycling factor
MINKTIASLEKKMQASLEGMKADLATIRTGRASPALVSRLKVDYLGVLTPLNQMASISAPEARLLVIQPWDKSTIKSIEKAIQQSELSLTPASDGNVIRLAIPPLSEERRQELIKIVRRRLEERKVILRNLRRDAVNDVKNLEKSKEISQDESKRSIDQLQKLTDRVTQEAEKIGLDKEKELAEV